MSDWDSYVEVTGCDVAQLICDAYDMSKPQGLGFLHFTPDPLPYAEAERLLDEWSGDREYDIDGTKVTVRWGADYLHGRSMKFQIIEHLDVVTRLARRWIPKRWHDHTDEQVEELMLRHGAWRMAQREQIDRFQSWTRAQVLERLHEEPHRLIVITASIRTFRYLADELDRCEFDVKSVNASGVITGRDGTTLHCIPITSDATRTRGLDCDGIWMYRIKPTRPEHVDLVRDAMIGTLRRPDPMFFRTKSLMING